MSDEGLLLGLACALAGCVLPIVAIVTASRAGRESSSLRAEVRQLRAALEAATQRLASLEHGVTARAPNPFRTAAALLTALPEAAPPEPDPLVGTERSTDDADGATVVPAPALQGVPPATSDAGDAAAMDEGASSTPPADVQERVEAAGAARAVDGAHEDGEDHGGSLEERIGILWFTRIGAAVLVLGAAYFFKLSVDNNWIGPVHRVLLGVAAGVAVLGFAERIRQRTRALYVQILLGVGVSLLYVSGYATYGFYHLAPVPAAFAALAAVSVLAGALSVRHRAQPILIVALAAALANPLILSSGRDNAAGLAAYVLLVTSAALAVALRQRFALAGALALIGSALVGVAWYGRFFVGGTAVAPAYAALDARLVPLGALAAFVLQWTWLARRARAVGWEAISPLGVMTAAVLAAHVGALALLHDAPAALAGATVLATAVAVFAQRSTGASWIVGVGQAPAFAALALAAHGSAGSPGAVLAAIGAWLVAQSAALAPAMWSDEARWGRGARPLAALALEMAMVLAALAWLPASPRALALSVLVLSALLAALAHWTGARGGAALGALVATGCLLLARSPDGRVDDAVLVLSGATALVYVLESSRHLVVRRGTPDVLAGVALVAGPLSFLAVTLAHTSAADEGVRAAACACGSLALIVPAAVLWRRRPEARGVANAALATGAAFALGALAARLPGVSVTVAWALVALAIAWLASITNDRQWMFGAAVVLVLTLLRVLFRDAPALEQARADFEWSLGQRGALAPAVLVNVRSIGLSAVGLAALGAAWALRGAEAGSERRAVSGTLATVGYAVLLGNAVLEVRGLLTTYPPLPGGPLDREQLDQYLAAVNQVVENQSGRRAVGATMVLGVAGLALLIAGFATKSLLHRWLGLLVLGGTVLKLALWDVWNLTRPQQVLVLVGVGALLLGAGYLYARLGSRLLKMLGRSPPARRT